MYNQMFRAFQGSDTKDISIEFVGLSGDISEDLLGGDGGSRDRTTSSTHISDLYVKKLTQLNPMKTVIESNYNHSTVVPHWSWAESYNVVLSSQTNVVVDIKKVRCGKERCRLYTATVDGRALSVRRFKLDGHADRIFGVEIGWNGTYVTQKIPEYNGYWAGGYTVKTSTKIEQSVPSTKNIVFWNNFQMIRNGSNTFAVDFTYPAADFSPPLTHDAAFIIASTMFHDNE